MEHVPAAQLIGYLMTGMGDDGAEAMADLHAQGGAHDRRGRRDRGRLGNARGVGARRRRRLTFCRCRSIAQTSAKAGAPCRSSVSPVEPASHAETERCARCSTGARQRESRRALGRRPRAAAELPTRQSLPWRRRCRRRATPRVREAMFTSLARIGTREAIAGDAADVALRRCRPAHGRSRCIALHRSSPTHELLPQLLDDPDVDVRILSCELARSLPSEEASRSLLRAARPRGRDQCLRGGGRGACGSRR